MGGARLLRRRLGAHPVAVAAITVSVLASLVVVTALQLLSARITDAGVRSALDVPPVDRSVVVTGSLRPGELDATDAAVRAALAPLAGATVTRVGTATSRGIAGRGSSDRAALADVEGLQQAAELTAGRWPRQPAASSSAPRRVEVVLPDAAATALAVAPGGSLDLTDLVDPQAPRVTAEVVGTFRPRDAEDGLWSDLPLALDGVTASDFTSYGPFVVAPGTFDGSLVGTSTVTWRAVPDLAGVRAAALPATGARADDVLTRLRTLTGLPTVEGVQASAGPATVPLRSPRVASDLPALVDGAAVVGDRVRVSLLTPAMLLVLLGSVALVGAAALLATLRDGETRLLRVRGASTLRLAGLALGDAVVVAVVGVLGAVLGAPVVTRAVSGSGAWWSAAVLRDATLWRALVPLALLAVAVTVATTLWVGRSREDARSRRAGLRLAAGSGLDVVLVVLGALAALQLRRYDAVGQRSVDLVTTIAPALVVAGLSVLALRLLPLLARVVARWGARRPGLDAAWGGWQFARRAATQGGTLLLVLLAVAMGTIALGHSATVDRAVADQSAFDAGAPLRVVQQVAGPAAGATGALVDRAAGDPGRVTPVWRTSLDLGSVEGVTVLGVDARAAARVLQPRPDTLDAPWAEVTGRLLAGRDLGDGLALPGAPREVSVTAKIVATGSSSAVGPEGFAASLAVRDARGIVTSVPLGAVGPEQRTLTADLSRLGLVAPLSVVGLSVPLPDFVYFFVPEPTFELVLTSLAADGTDVPLGRVLAPHSDRAGLWLAAAPGRTSAVPAVVTREVADALRTGRGGRVTLPLGLRELPVEVVAVVDSLPTAQRPGGASSSTCRPSRRPPSASAVARTSAAGSCSSPRSGGPRRRTPRGRPRPCAPGCPTARASRWRTSWPRSACATPSTRGCARRCSSSPSRRSCWPGSASRRAPRRSGGPGGTRTPSSSRSARRRSASGPSSSSSASSSSPSPWSWASSSASSPPSPSCRCSSAATGTRRCRRCGSSCRPACSPGTCSCSCSPCRPWAPPCCAARAATSRASCGGGSRRERPRGTGPARHRPGRPCRGCRGPRRPRPRAPGARDLAGPCRRPRAAGRPHGRLPRRHPPGRVGGHGRRRRRHRGGRPGPGARGGGAGRRRALVRRPVSLGDTR